MTTTAPRVGDTPTTAQQALAEAWAEGHRTGWEHCQDGNYGNDHWDDPTPNPYAAAGRAETTTATTEDAARVLVRETTSGLCEYGRVCDECDCFADAGGGERDAHALELARALDREGLLATARTVNVHPTYTVEYQQKIADELGVEREAVLRALGLAAPLLATARTRPTREQIDRAVGEVLSNAANHPDPVAVLGRSIAPLRTKITDAVLELLRDGAR